MIPHESVLKKDLLLLLYSSKNHELKTAKAVNIMQEYYPELTEEDTNIKYDSDKTGSKFNTAVRFARLRLKDEGMILSPLQNRKGFWKLSDSGIKQVLNKTEKILNKYKTTNNEDIENTTRTLREVNQINRNRLLVNSLKVHYNNTCQICKTRIELKENSFYSEVHHLKPLGTPHNGPDIVENMIVVCPNCHVKLDYKAIQINLHYLLLKAPHKIGIEFIEYQNRI